MRPSFECVTGAQVTSLESTVSFHLLLLDLLCSSARHRDSINAEKLTEALPLYSSLSSIGKSTD